MTVTVEERIRRAAMQLDEAIEERAGAGGTYLVERRTAPGRRVAWIAAAAALVVVAGAVVVMQGGGVETVSAPAAGLVDGEGWERLPESPLGGRFQHLGVSTGTGMLVWGGHDGETDRTDGAFFDAVSATWKAVPKAPLAGNRGDAIGAWTGTEVVVVNGIDGQVKAAAYRPATNRWRKLPDPPLANAASMMTKAVFVDGAVVVVAVSEEGEPGVRNEVAVLDPATSTWRIGAVPASSFGSGFDTVVVGSEAVLVARYGMGGKGCGASVVAAYSPTANAWRSLDGGPLSSVFASAVASTGTEVFVAGGPCGGSDDSRLAFLLDPATGRWRTAAEAPVAVRGDIRYGEVFTGTAVLTFAADGTPVFYDLASDSWEIGVAGPVGKRLQETPWVWAGGRLVAFSGGVTEGKDGLCCPMLAGGYTYTLRP